MRNPQEDAANELINVLEEVRRDVVYDMCPDVGLYGVTVEWAIKTRHPDRLRVCLLMMDKLEHLLTDGLPGDDPEEDRMGFCIDLMGCGLWHNPRKMEVLNWMIEDLRETATVKA